MTQKIVSIAVGMSMMGGSVALPFVAFAEHSDEHSKTQKDKTEKRELHATMKEARAAAKVFSLQLRRGMTGDEVMSLQEFLAQYPDVYPEGLITGFFGALTENAVKRFQRKHGIDQVGQVGPATRARLHALLDEWLDSGRHIPPGLFKKLDRLGTTTGATSTAPSTPKHEEFKVRLCHKPGQANETISVALPALVAHILHGDTVGACSGGTGTTTPPVVDTTPPTISSVTATSIASTSAHITWTTSENADSRVWYSTSTPVSTSTATTVTNAGLLVSHDLTLSPLTASTTYYYKVSSKDSLGNEAMSSESSFSTLP